MTLLYGSRVISPWLALRSEAASFFGSRRPFYLPLRKSFPGSVFVIIGLGYLDWIHSLARQLSWGDSFRSFRGRKGMIG
jgi:hypothetical protein